MAHQGRLPRGEEPVQQGLLRPEKALGEAQGLLLKPLAEGLGVLRPEETEELHPKEAVDVLLLAGGLDGVGDPLIAVAAAV